MKTKKRATMLARLADPEKRAAVDACLAIGRGPHTEERRAHLSTARKGMKFSDSHREAIRRARLGSKSSSETRAKIAAASRRLRLKPLVTPASRAKAVAALKAKTYTPEERARAAEKSRGRKHRPEAIAKMRAARALQVMPLKRTRLELAVGALLVLLGVGAEVCRGIPGVAYYQWDFIIRDRRIAVEADGCYWHGCEACGYKPRRRKEDATRDEAAALAGWRVIRVAEHEMKRSQEVLERLRKEILG
jgi:DNA mismatch endonuclease (patch repair protein)